MKIVAQNKSLEDLMEPFGVRASIVFHATQWLPCISEKYRLCFWKQDSTSIINGLVVFCCMASDKLTLHNTEGPAQIIVRRRDDLWTIHKCDLLYRIAGDRWAEEDFYARPEMLEIKLNNIICLQ